MRIVYRGTCFPLDAYSMRIEGSEICLENVYKDGRVIIISCLMDYRAKNLVTAIRKAYKNGEKIFFVDEWLGWV